MEECRAEAVALYRELKVPSRCCTITEPTLLSVASNPTILKIFGASPPLSHCLCYLLISQLQYTDQKACDDIVYITFLVMARSGLRGLEYYDPATKKHGQAHMQAR